MKKLASGRAFAPAKDIHATVTNALIAAIEGDPGAWTMPWRASGQSLKLPVNAQSRRAYRGINTVVGNSATKPSTTSCRSSAAAASHGARRITRTRTTRIRISH